MCKFPSSRFTKIEEHAYAVGEAVLRYTFESSHIADEQELESHRNYFVGAGGLLCLAGGLRNVDIFTGRYEEDVQFCGSAYEWEKRRSVVVSAYATDVVRFLYVYNAFESVVGSLPISNRARRNTSLAASRFLKNYHGPVMLPLEHYQCTIDSLRHIVGESTEWNELRVLLKTETDLALDFAVMSLVQKIRNRFIHEALSLPREPESPQMQDRSILKIATRMTLLTIQMLMIAHADRIDNADWVHDPIGLLKSAHLMDQDD